MEDSWAFSQAKFLWRSTPRKAFEAWQGHWIVFRHGTSSTQEFLFDAMYAHGVEVALRNTPHWSPSEKILDWLNAPEWPPEPSLFEEVNNVAALISRNIRAIGHNQFMVDRYGIQLVEYAMKGIKPSTLNAMWKAEELIRRFVSFEQNTLTGVWLYDFQADTFRRCVIKAMTHSTDDLNGLLAHLRHYGHMLPGQEGKARLRLQQIAHEEEIYVLKGVALDYLNDFLLPLE